MARYALEPIPDPAVDSALRDALGKLKGRPLIGVIGSIGVRRDAKAVDLLCRLLKDNDADVAQAAARALGSMGTAAAVEALEDALADGTRRRSTRYLRRACSGAPRPCRRPRPNAAAAIAIYERLNQPQNPRQVRDGASRKARILRQEKGRTI